MNQIIKKYTFIISLIAVTVSCVKVENSSTEKKADSDMLTVLWTSGDRDVALKMVFMYSNYTAKSKHWSEVNFIVWGPSSKLLSEDKELQDYIAKMKKNGIKLYACKACSDMYGVSDKLSDLGIKVKYMGNDLTSFLKKNHKVLTF